MKKMILTVVLFGSLAFAGDVKHRFIANCVNQGAARMIAEDGSVKWELTGLRLIQDSWQLENGNVLVSYRSGVKEVSPDKQVVWQYKAPEEVELHSVQPIEDGKVLAVECGTKRLIEIDRTGTIVKEIPLQSSNPTHTQFRSARKTSRGTYWVAYIGQGKVRELDCHGKTLRELTVSDGFKNAHGVEELPNGNLLVSTANGGDVKEFNKQDQLVWHLTQADMRAAGVSKIGYTAGIKRLSNGNTVVSMYHGNPQFFEVTPDKKIVWQYHNEQFGNVSGFCLLK